MLGRGLRWPLFIISNHRARVLFLMQLRYPELRISGSHRYISECCHRVFVENVYCDASVLEQVAHQVRVGKICGGVDTFHGIIIACNACMKKAARLSSCGLRANSGVR